jgi:hypothetical protein
LRKKKKTRNEMSILDVKRGKTWLWKTVLTRIWGRLGSGERHSHEEKKIRESGGGGDLDVKVFA